MEIATMEAAMKAAAANDHHAVAPIGVWAPIAPAERVILGHRLGGKLFVGQVLLERQLLEA